MMGVFGYTPSRNKILDYTLPTAMSSMALLIPKPTIQTKNYISAVIEPFQPLVTQSNPIIDPRLCKYNFINWGV
jgi:hypothetical protein